MTGRKTGRLEVVEEKVMTLGRLGTRVVAYLEVLVFLITVIFNFDHVFFFGNLLPFYWNLFVALSQCDKGII